MSMKESEELKSILARKTQNTNQIQSDYKVEDHKFYSESQKQEKLLNINLLRKLDEKIDSIRKNKANLDIFEAITESTIKMCMEHSEKLELINKENINYNQDFYNDIEKELLNIESQL